ncbi:MAG TPA: hypothetical protein VJY39_05855 [Acidisphaera sp.]|nr:hypothetical protein [Acidisphaera sp.]
MSAVTLVTLVGCFVWRMSPRRVRLRAGLFCVVMVREGGPSTPGSTS